MITLIDIVHDLQVAIRLWKNIEDEVRQESAMLIREYGAEHFYVDEDTCEFTLDGKKYNYEYGNEQLFRMNEEFEDPPEVTSGKAYDFITRYYGTWDKLYSTVENELERRGWFTDRDDYCFNLYKDGWSTDLSYFPSGNDFDVDVGEFEYEDGYYGRN
jgi:hypothetical protein